MKGGSWSPTEGAVSPDNFQNKIRFTTPKQPESDIRGNEYKLEKVRLERYRQCIHNHPPVGSKIKFSGEKQRYTVRASNTAYAICTKPFNARKTVLYTIVDTLRGVRGPENLAFGFGAETDEQCQEMLERITIGETEVSYRHDLPLDIEFIEVFV